MKILLLSVSAFVAVFTLFTLFGAWLFLLSGEPLVRGDTMFELVGAMSFLGFFLGILAAASVSFIFKEQSQ